jgi:GNAT superfamily N-acetyltransferase
VIPVEVPCPEFNRFLYAAVGWQWYWIDKLSWDYEQWRSLVTRPTYRTWVGYVSGTPAGYYELDQQADAHIELAYFGLLPQFTGQGLGGPLLTSAIESAWDWGARRVWVHTCSLDHPSALANYETRGFKQYKVEHSQKTIPASASRGWQ